MDYKQKYLKYKKKYMELREQMGGTYDFAGEMTPQEKAEYDNLTKIVKNNEALSTFLINSGLISEFEKYKKDFEIPNGCSSYIENHYKNLKKEGITENFVSKILYEIQKNDRLSATNYICNYVTAIIHGDKVNTDPYYTKYYNFPNFGGGLVQAELKPEFIVIINDINDKRKGYVIVEKKESDFYGNLTNCDVSGNNTALYQQIIKKYNNEPHAIPVKVDYIVNDKGQLHVRKEGRENEAAAPSLRDISENNDNGKRIYNFDEKCTTSLKQKGFIKEKEITEENIMPTFNIPTFTNDQIERIRDSTFVDNIRSINDGEIFYKIKDFNAACMENTTNLKPSDILNNFINDKYINDAAKIKNGISVFYTTIDDLKNTDCVKKFQSDNPPNYEQFINDYPLKLDK